MVVKSEESCSEGSKHLEDSKALQCCDLNDDVGTDKPCRQLDCRMEENDAVSFIELERASSEIERLKSFTPCETCREYSGTWCSSAKRENFNKLSFSCLNYGTQIRRASLASLTHTAKKKYLKKSTLEYKLDYDENLTRASRSNTGTCDLNCPTGCKCCVSQCDPPGCSRLSSCASCTWCSSAKRENSLSHVFTRMSIVSLLSFVSLIHIRRKSLEHATLKCTLKCYATNNVQVRMGSHI